MARDDVMELMIRWRIGEINYLEMTEVATEYLDGRVGAALQGNDGAISVIAELTTATSDLLVEEKVEQLLREV